MSKRQILIERMCQNILALDESRPVMIGIDGVDGSGKSSFAGELCEELKGSGRQIIHSAVDFFHNPRARRYAEGKEVHESFFEDSFNYDALKEKLLDPVRDGRGGECVLRHFDHVSDCEVKVDPIAVDSNAIFVFDGIFIHRDELAGYWDYSFFLDVSFEESFRRLSKRDGFPADPADCKNKRYYEGQKLYIERCNPKVRATVVVDNNDFQVPKIEFRNLKRGLVYMPEGRGIELRKSAYGICVVEGRVLLIKSAFNQLWELPGGRCDGEEVPLETMKREFTEETLYEVPEDQEFEFEGQHQEYFYVDTFDRYCDSNMSFFRFNKVGERASVELDAHEVEDVQWFSLKELERVELHPISAKLLLSLAKVK